MGDPAGHSGDGEEGGKEVLRDAQHVVGETGIEVHIGGDGLAPSLKDLFPDRVLEKAVEGEFIHAVLFLGQVPAKSPEDLRPGVGQGIDRVAEAVDQSCIVIVVMVQDPVHDIQDLVPVVRIADVGNDLVHHLGHGDVGAAVLGAFERADRAADGGIDIRAGGAHDDVGEGGVVAAAVVRVDDQDAVQEVGLSLGELAVRPEHVEDVLRYGVFRTGIMDDQGLAVELMDLGLVAVAGDGRELGDQIDALAEHLIGIDLVRIIVIVIELQGSRHESVHEVLGGIVEKLTDQEIIGEVIAGGKGGPEIAEGPAVRQIAEKEEEAGFLIAEVPLPVGDQVLDAVSAVEQVAVDGNDVSLRVLLIADDVGDPGQADPDAGPVIIPQSLLDIMLLEKMVGDVCIVGGFAVKTGQDRIIMETGVIAHVVCPFCKVNGCVYKCIHFDLVIIA